MKKITFLLSFFAFVFSSQTFAQYGCSSGVVITDGYTANGITTPGTAGPEDWNTNPTTTCGGTSNSYWDDDVYLFTYTAGATDEEISMTTFSRNSWNGLGIFSTCTGTALDGCLDTAGATSSNSTKTVTANIAAGQTVYIAVGQWGTPNDLDFDVTEFSVTPLVNPPSCTTLSSPLNGATDASTSGDISWDAAAGAATDYLLEVGTTSGGSEVFSGQVGNVTTYNVGALSGNTTYYVTITPSNSNGVTSGCTEESFTTFEPVANDECANAIALTVNEDLSCTEITSATTQYSTASPQPDDATGTPNTDVWFTFVATATNNNIVISNVVNQGGGTSTSTDMGMSVFDDAAGCNMTAANEVGESDPNTLQLSGLTIGNTYYVRVYGWQSGIQYNNFDICVGTPAAPPANDDCAGAIEVTTSEDANCSNTVSGTTESATTNSANGCSTTGRDVWYSFTAAEDGSYTITVDETFDSGFTSTYVSAYEGECGSLTQVGSSTSCFNTGDLVVSTVAGETYYVNVRSSSSSNYVEFDLCIYLNPPPPANDDCAGAIALTIPVASTCPANTTATTTSATEGINELTSCDASGNYGIWYTFTAPTSGAMEFTSGTGSPGVTIYEGTDCGTLTEVSGTCLNNTSGSISGLTPGNDYWAMVWTDTEQATVEFCLYSLPCSAAVATTSLVENCASDEFSIDIDITDLGSSSTLTITYDDGSGALTTTTSTTGVTNIGPFSSGSTVSIVLNNESDSACDATLTDVTYTCPPVNDDISNATPITIGEMICDGSTNNGTNVGATNSGEGAGTCFIGGAGSDVWYTFTLSSDSDVTVSTDYLGGTLVDTQIAVYSGMSGALVEEGCSQDDGVETLSNGFSWNSLISDLTLTAGTYYVQVSGYSGAEGTFCLSVDAVSLSTQDFDKEATFTYYPNPVNNNLTLSAQKEINNVSVYNMVGQEVFRNVPNAMTEVVDMSSLQAGAYFVKVTIGNATKTVKVIKN
ncbi:T9SS type A sorting domain-containing protein [Mesoflavibacter sp.]|uniref:T9SS type A sorting domain-containing protein n=1 Tax=Mesoflavibacter sp. TaxID=1930902 RepID=UPI0035175CA9